MERQHLYERQNFGQGIGGGGVRGARVLDAPKYQNPLLDIFLQAVDTGKTAVQAGAKEYDRRQRLHIEDAVNKVNAEMDAWELEYMKTHQGVDAQTAQKDFADQFQKLSQTAIDAYGGDDYYKNMLSREFVKPAMYAIKRGTQYQYQQDELWQKSVFDGTMSTIKQGVWQNADDSDHVESLIQRGEQAIRDRFPGQDVTAKINDFRESMMADQVNSLIENNRLSEAQTALDRYAGGSSGGAAMPGNWNGSARTKGAPQSAIDLVRNAAKRHGVDENLALAVMMQESGGNQKSISHAGAIGLMQLMPGTARGLGVNPHDPAQNADGGVRYLKQMLKEFGGNVNDALTAYNWGPGNMRKHIRNGRSGTVPKEAREYASRVNGRMEIVGKSAGSSPATQVGGNAVVPASFAVPAASTGASGRAFASPKLATLQAKIDAANRNEQSQLEKMQKEAQKANLNNFLTQTNGIPTVERMKLAEQIYGRDPATREQYNAAIKGIEADDRAREHVRKAQEKQQEQALYAQLQACSENPDPAQSWQQARAVIEQLPFEQQDKYLKAYSNFRKHSASDDPLALEEVTDKIMNGEDFNIRAEYGGRLSNRTIQKFSNQAFQKAMPEIRTAFKDAASEWLGEKANSNLAKQYGYGGQDKLWTHFLNQTDADEKMDAPRLRKEADEFFKKVVLEHGWFGSEDTIYGLQGQTMKKYDDATPKKGTEAYDVALEFLRKKYPDTTKFSSEKIADAYRALTGNPRKEQK